MLDCVENGTKIEFRARGLEMKALRQAGVSLLLGLTAISLTPISQAAVILQTGFESSEVPGYSTGQLSGQNGWAGSTVAVVENSTVFSGLQAVSMDSTGLSGQNLFGHNLTYDSSSDPNQIVVFDIQFMESTTGNRSNWDAINVGANGVYITQLIVQTNGLAVLGVDSGAVGSIPVSRGTSNDFQLVLDFQTQTVSGYVNSQLLGSGSFANPTTVLTRVNLGENSSPNGDSGFFDQLSVTSVPEPGYAGLVTAGLAIIAFRSRKRASR
jgi:hypothetical protein